MAEISYDNTEYTRGMQDAINDIKRAIEKRNSKKSSDGGEKMGPDSNGDEKMNPESNGGENGNADDKSNKKMNPNSSNGGGNGDGGDKSDGDGKNKGDVSKSEDGKLSADDAVNKKEGGNEGDNGGNETDGEEGEGGDGEEGGNGGKNHHKDNGDSDFIAKLKDDLGKMTDEEVAKYEEYSKGKIKDTLTDARNNGVGGMLYDFFQKCAGCATTIHGMRVMTKESGAGWFEKLDKIIDTYVKQKITRQPKVYKRTFSRIARRQSVNPDIINKGKIEKKNKIQLKVAFYMDCSGSMGSRNRYKNVVVAANTIADSLDEAYKKSDIIQVDEEKSFMFYKFDRDWNKDNIEQMDRGDLNMPLGGGTPSAASLINHISEGVNGYEGKDAVVNVIMTDGYMDGAETAMAEALNKYPNFMFIFITCDFQADIKSMALSGAYSNLAYIQSDDSFNLK